MNLLQELLSHRHPLKSDEPTNTLAHATQQDNSSKQPTSTDPAETRKKKRKAGQIKKNKLKQLKKQRTQTAEAAHKANITMYLLRK